MLTTYRGSAFIYLLNIILSTWQKTLMMAPWLPPLGCPWQVSTWLCVGPWLISNQWSAAKDRHVTCVWLNYIALQHLSFSLLLALQRQVAMLWAACVGGPCGKELRAAPSSSRQPLIKTFSITVVESEFCQKKRPTLFPWRPQHWLTPLPYPCEILEEDQDKPQGLLLTYKLWEMLGICCVKSQFVVIHYIEIVVCCVADTSLDIENGPWTKRSPPRI